MIVKTFIMLGLICLLALIVELDFFIALPKFGAEHFGAPDDIKELVKNMPDRPRSVEYFGIAVLIASFVGIVGVFVWAIVDTYRNYSGLLDTFLRFLIILEGYKLFDIVVFDWLLMTKIRLPEKLCSETQGAKGYDSFGFNAKSQLLKIILFAILSALIALIFSLICHV